MNILMLPLKILRNSTLEFIPIYLMTSSSLFQQMGISCFHHKNIESNSSDMKQSLHTMMVAICFIYFKRLKKHLVNPGLIFFYIKCYL